MNSLETLLLKIIGSKVIQASTAAAVDLSIFNKALDRFDLSNSKDFTNFIDSFLIKNQVEMAFGGYNEKRNLYKTSQIFNQETQRERNIHIGLDLWIKAETPILAALDGKIHSYNFNRGVGNYGPTIILEHRIESQHFYTLYGHLSMQSLDHLKIGADVKQNESFAMLGDHTANGGYAPHLHFQIIKNIENYNGDYPGVCSSADLNYYLENCPDPNLLLKLNTKS